MWDIHYLISVTSASTQLLIMLNWLSCQERHLILKVKIFKNETFLQFQTWLQSWEFCQKIQKEFSPKSICFVSKPIFQNDHAIIGYIVFFVFKSQGNQAIVKEPSACLPPLSTSRIWIRYHVQDVFLKTNVWLITDFRQELHSAVVFGALLCFWRDKAIDASSTLHTVSYPAENANAICIYQMSQKNVP